VTIYFVAFRSKFDDQVKPQLKNVLDQTYEGPNKLITNDPNKPPAISIAWDFIMYNVSDSFIVVVGAFFSKEFFI
jgi:hypothetical protein